MTQGIDDSRVSRRRSSVFPTRSAAIEPAARRGSTRTAARPKTTQNQPWKRRLVLSWIESLVDRSSNQKVMSTNIATWSRTNVQAKAPDCTP
jgi:hypothetical protein